MTAGMVNECMSGYTRAMLRVGRFRIRSGLLMSALLLVLIVITIGVLVSVARVPDATAAPTAAASARAGLSCWKQRGALRLCGALTDNYKQCFNPSVARETRSWLSWTAVSAGGATYRTAPGQPQFSPRLNLRRVAGSGAMPTAAYITLRVSQNPHNVRVITERADYRTRRVGPLLDYRSMYSLSRRPIAYVVLLRDARTNAVLASAHIAYRYDRALAASRPGSAEHRGPGGRWYVNGQRTRTDVESGVFAGC